MNLLIRLLINGLALYVVSYLIPGFYFNDIYSLVVTVVVIGVVNTFIKPILQIIALPISILTLGLFAFFINVALLYSVAYFVPGFEIDEFTTAIVSSILLTIVSWFLNRLAKENHE